MGHPSRQFADGLEFLRLAQFLLESLADGDVADGGVEEPVPVDVEEGGVDLDLGPGPVLPNVGRFEEEALAQPGVGHLP